MQNRTNLVAKDYQLVVTDAFGCQVRELNKELSKPEREDWTSSGNLNNNANSFFGTKANSTYPDVIFKTLDVEGFRLKSNLDALFTGKIGVGTTIPTEKLEVSGGNAKFGGNTTVLGELTMPNKANPNFNLIGFDANGNLTTNPTPIILTELYKDAGPFTCTLCPGYAGIDGQFHTTPMWRVFSNSYTQDGYLRNCTPVSIGCTELPANTMFHVAGNVKVDGNTTQQGDINLIGSGNYLRNGAPLQLTQWANNTNGIDYNAGKVGIGTNNPQYNLDIQQGGSTALRVKGDIKFGHYSDDDNYLKITNDGANGFIDLYSNYVSSTGVPGGRLFINNNSSKGVLIGNGGLIVKGETHIEHSLHSKEMLVCSNGWCDYVFDKSYKLAPILDVEKYINANKHLPEIPSAEEISNSEVNLFEMQKLQMKKIEELTLYIIELQKQLNALKTNANEK